MIIDFYNRNGGGGGSEWSAVTTEIENHLEDVERVTARSLNDLNAKTDNYWSSAVTKIAIQDAIEDGPVRNVFNFGTASVNEVKSALFNYNNSSPVAPATYMKLLNAAYLDGSYITSEDGGLVMPMEFNIDLNELTATIENVPAGQYFIYAERSSMETPMYDDEIELNECTMSGDEPFWLEATEGVSFIISRDNSVLATACLSFIRDIELLEIKIVYDEDADEDVLVWNVEYVEDRVEKLMPVDDYPEEAEVGDVISLISYDDIFFGEWVIEASNEQIFTFDINDYGDDQIKAGKCEICHFTADDGDHDADISISMEYDEVWFIEVYSDGNANIKELDTEAMIEDPQGTANSWLHTFPVNDNSDVDEITISIEYDENDGLFKITLMPQKDQQSDYVPYECNLNDYAQIHWSELMQYDGAEWYPVVDYDKMVTPSHSSGYADILHIKQISQSDYDDLVDNDEVDANTMYIINDDPIE